MKTIKVTASAKINLSLDILGKTKFGYHTIQTVFQEIPTLQDVLILTETNKKLSLSPELSKSHPALKALQLVKKKYKIKKNIKIQIEQNIPFSSGLGGTSSNAAAVLKALNKLWQLNITKSEFQELAEQIGMDTAFFLQGGTALGENYGEKITALPSIKGINFKIFAKTISTSSTLSNKIHPLSKTKNAYQSLDLKKCGKNTNKTTALIQAIKDRNTSKILENIHNDFEQLYDLTKSNPPHHISGSGPSTFVATAE